MPPLDPRVPLSGVEIRTPEADEDVTLVCMRVSDSPVSAAAKSSKQKCDKCGAAIWYSCITAQSVKHVKKVVLRCIRCASDDPKSDGGKIGVTPDTYGEAMKSF